MAKTGFANLLGQTFGSPCMSVDARAQHRFGSGPAVLIGSRPAVLIGSRHAVLIGSGPAVLIGSGLAARSRIGVDHPPPISDNEYRQNVVMEVVRGDKFLKFEKRRLSLCRREKERLCLVCCPF